MPQILEAMKDSPDFYFDSMAQIHMPNWSKGHIALVGDAAYSATPMSGQGTVLQLSVHMFLLVNLQMLEKT